VAAIACRCEHAYGLPLGGEGVLQVDTFTAGRYSLQYPLIFDWMCGCGGGVNAGEGVEGGGVGQVLKRALEGHFVDIIIMLYVFQQAPCAYSNNST
jgi:hypothetical protein